MSKETIEWLNANVLVGLTDNRGHAWHYRMGSDNHYPGPIPVGDVQRRLFNWEPVVEPIVVRGNPVPGRKAVVRSDNEAVMGIFTDSYQPHNYNEWLIGAVSNIIGDTLGVGSAGLLSGGAVAWVQVEVPESVETPEGVVFRPNLLATTSLDGTVATTYKRTVTIVVCDNTHRAAVGEAGQEYRVRHTSRSQLRIADARDALAILERQADDTTAEISRLAKTEVTDAQWEKFLEETAPVSEGDSKNKVTVAERKRSELTQLWNNDTRVSPWRNTAWGVVAAANTWHHHMMTVRYVNHRAERNMENAIKGKIDQHDSNVEKTLEKILA